MSPLPPWSLLGQFDPTKTPPIRYHKKVTTKWDVLAATLGAIGPYTRRSWLDSRTSRVDINLYLPESMI
jgi:hypothetical protein